MSKTSTVPIAQLPRWYPRPSMAHMAQFYAAEDHLLSSLLEYIYAGLEVGDTCIIIAKPPTLIGLNKRLRAVGADVASVLRSGQYITYDAEELLATFMRHDVPEHSYFARSVGQLVARAANRGRPIRAFGEMVALLLDQQNIAGLMSLEKFWNDLMTSHHFSLYCAYPAAAFQNSCLHRSVLEDICSCHSAMVGGLDT